MLYDLATEVGSNPKHKTRATSLKPGSQYDAGASVTSAVSRAQRHERRERSASTCSKYSVRQQTQHCNAIREGGVLSTNTALFQPLHVTWTRLLFFVETR